MPDDALASIGRTEVLLPAWFRDITLALVRRAWRDGFAGGWSLADRMRQVR